MRDFGTESLHSHRHRAARTAVPITAEADYALAYTADLFNRLTGYPALERLKQARTREALAEAEYATAYANDTFERLRGVPERRLPVTIFGSCMTGIAATASGPGGRFQRPSTR